MNESEFNQRVDALYEQIEDAVDNGDYDIDCEQTGAVLTLHCEDGSAIVFSRQSATQELWLAARGGGFHFRFGEGGWFSQKEGQTLDAIFARACREQLGGELDVSL